MVSWLRMRIDLHTHCLPVSSCSRHINIILPTVFKNANMDAIVLTNHCYPLHCDKLSNDLKEQAKIYVDTYSYCRDYGHKIGFKVFFGVEIKLINESNAPEFLLYGISENDFIESYPLYKKSQKELFDFCNEKNILLVQAHPYRSEQGYEPADMRYLHGIEVYNGHPNCAPNFEKTLKLATINKKIKTAGSDFHIQNQAGSAGMIVPDYINDQFMLRDFLRENKAIIFDEHGILFEG